MSEDAQTWVQRARENWFNNEYDQARANAQISIALSLQRIAEALECKPTLKYGIWDNTTAKPIENPDMQYSTDRFVSPAGDVRAAALEIEANIADLEDTAAQRSIVGDISAIIAKHLYPTDDHPREAIPEFKVIEKAVADYYGSRHNVAAADPFDGVCGRCGWELKHLAHDEKYGSHKFEPSPYKSLGEWREGTRSTTP